MTWQRTIVLKFTDSENKISTSGSLAYLFIYLFIYFWLLWLLGGFIFTLEKAPIPC